MTAGQAASLYEHAKDDALRFARDFVGRFRK